MKNLRIRTKPMMVVAAATIPLLIGAGLAYTQAASVEQKLRLITDVKRPKSQAALQMEINLLETGFALLGYLHDHDPVHLERIHRGAQEFEKYQTQFHELAHTAEARNLGVRVGGDYARLRTLADALIRIEDTKLARTSTLQQACN